MVRKIDRYIAHIYKNTDNTDLLFPYYVLVYKDSKSVDCQIITEESNQVDNEKESTIVYNGM